MGKCREKHPPNPPWERPFITFWSSGHIWSVTWKTADWNKPTTGQSGVLSPFVMGRKNWLFSNTPGGAKSSAVIYSLVETVRESGLDPYRYLLWVFKTAPALAVQDKAWAEKLVPAAAPIYCYVPGKKENAI